MYDTIVARTSKHSAHAKSGGDHSRLSRTLSILFHIIPYLSLSSLHFREKWLDNPKFQFQLLVQKPLKTMASNSNNHIPVDFAAAASTADRIMTCHICIANPDDGSILPGNVWQPHQQQQEKNISIPQAALKTCLLCSKDYCPRHEGDQEGVCDSNHISLWKNKKALLDDGRQHQGVGGTSRPAGRTVRVFRSLEQRPQRA